MFYFRIKLDTENASRLASGTKGGATSGWEADRLQPLCLSTRGAFPVFWTRKDNVLQGWVFFLMQCNGDKKISPRLTSLMLKWNVEFKCLLTFFGQLAPLRVMPKTGIGLKPERLSRRAKHDAAVTPHL